MNSILERRVSIAHAVTILAKGGINASKEEAYIILDFLYLMAKNHPSGIDMKNVKNPKVNSNSV
ncbi:hypothetical protein SRABI36_03554 [Pedobacter sp. Bi36]|nr:hypothetical protein SRABI36_03554 [Pedobacter sp. Bi36]CAH0290848.1 hypothetical protein SRABI126_04048 [Pedobacter sp. Bi126]